MRICLCVLTSCATSSVEKARAPITEQPKATSATDRITPTEAAASSNAAPLSPRWRNVENFGPAGQLSLHQDGFGRTYVFAGSSFSAFVLRFNAEGERDFTFGDNGTLSVNCYAWPGGFSVAPDGTSFLTNTCAGKIERHDAAGALIASYDEAHAQAVYAEVDASLVVANLVPTRDGQGVILAETLELARYDASGMRRTVGPSYALDRTAQVLQLLPAGSDYYAVGVDDAQAFAASYNNPDVGLFSAPERGWMTQTAFATSGKLALVALDWKEPARVPSVLTLLPLGQAGFYPCAVDAAGRFASVQLGTYDRYDARGHLLGRGGDLAGGRWQGVACRYDADGALLTAAFLKDGNLEVARWLALD